MTPIQVDDAINEAVENVAYVSNLSSDSSLVLADAESLGGLPAENYATKNYVVDTINQAQLGGDNSEVDLSIYATKDDLTLVSNAIPTTPEEIGARPNTWMPTIAEIGAAPAGFGYGEATRLVWWDDADGTKLEAYLDGMFTDNSMKNKVYRYILVDYPVCAASGQGGYADIVCTDFTGSTPQSITIVYYAVHGSAGVAIATKKKHAGVWYPWEYVNPPMMMSVEYRTTERHNGKPVYCKLIDGGYLPNTGTKSYKVAENADVVSFDSKNIPTVSLGGNIASTLQSDQVVSCYVGGDTVYISCGGDRSNLPFKFTVKYTKTTD